MGLPRDDLAATFMSEPTFIAAISSGSSAAFSTQADLPLVNIEKVLLPTVTWTLEFSWKL